MKTSLKSLVVFAALAANPVFAADAIVTEPVVGPSPASDWTGFYAGGHLGWVWDEAQWNVGAQPNFWGSTGDTASLNSNGGLAGGQVGYWYQLQNGWVFGGDLSASYADIDRSITSPSFPLTDTWEVGVDALLLAQLRAGFGLDRWMVFLQGGYAGGDVSARATSTLGPEDISASDWSSGWTIGAGASYRATDQISFGAEYNYVDLGSETYNFQVGAAPDVVDVDHQLHTVRFTLNFHFGR
ncbi:MAG: outer membrane beta-barrel protein [Pseudomonadota bacterium]